MDFFDWLPESILKYKKLHHLTEIDCLKDNLTHRTKLITGQVVLRLDIREAVGRQAVIERLTWIRLADQSFGRLVKLQDSTSVAVGLVVQAMTPLVRSWKHAVFAVTNSLAPRCQVESLILRAVPRFSNGVAHLISFHKNFIRWAQPRNAFTLFRKAIKNKFSEILKDYLLRG